MHPAENPPRCSIYCFLHMLSTLPILLGNAGSQHLTSRCILPRTHQDAKYIVFLHVLSTLPILLGNAGGQHFTSRCLLPRTHQDAKYIVFCIRWAHFPYSWAMLEVNISHQVACCWESIYIIFFICWAHFPILWGNTGSQDFTSSCLLPGVHQDA